MFQKSCVLQVLRNFMRDLPDFPWETSVELEWSQIESILGSSRHLLHLLCIGLLNNFVLIFVETKIWWTIFRNE